MKRARFGDEHIVPILRGTDKDMVVEVTKRHGFSEPTIYTWRKKFGYLQTDEVRRLAYLRSAPLYLAVCKQRESLW